ncbi:MAG: hypothetical protein AB1710_00045 [Pseudomonadota bacterium]
MRYVPSEPLYVPIKEPVDVKPVRYVRPARPVTARSIPPQVYRRARQKQPAAGWARRPLPPAEERAAGKERRRMSRRVSRRAVLLDTRSGPGRRRGNRRRADQIVVAVNLVA